MPSKKRSRYAEARALKRSAPFDTRLLPNPIDNPSLDPYPYKVEAFRVGGLWEIRVPGSGYVMTQGRDLAEVEPMAREYIAVTLDVPIETVAVEVFVNIRDILSD